MHVVDVEVPGGGDRSIAVQARAVDDEDVARGRFELVLLHARLGAANRFHHPEAGELRRFPDERHLARALDAAQLVEDRIEIADLRRAAGQPRDELLLSREAAVERIVENRPIARAQLAAALRVALGRLELHVDRLQARTGGASSAATAAARPPRAHRPVALGHRRRGQHVVDAVSLFTSSASSAESTLPSADSSAALRGGR